MLAAKPRRMSEPSDDVEKIISQLEDFHDDWDDVEDTDEFDMEG